MKTAWTEELCSSKPEQFERLSAEIWLQRKDIQIAPKKEGIPIPGYKCMSRQISQDVYEALMEEYESPTYKALADQQDAIDAANAEILMNQIDIETTQAEQDATLSEILLNIL